MLALPLASTTASACPELITCTSEQQMSVERDERGCNVVTCLKAEANQVDENYQDIPQAAKMQTVENQETAAPVVTIEPIHAGAAPVTVEVPTSQMPSDAAKEKVATENPALAAPVAEPESQKQPVVEAETPASEESVATKTPETSEPDAAHPAQAAEPSVAPEKAPRADTPAAPAAKAAAPSSAI